MFPTFAQQRHKSISITNENQYVTREAEALNHAFISSQHFKLHSLFRSHCVSLLPSKQQKKFEFMPNVDQSKGQIPVKPLVSPKLMEAL